MTTFLSDERLGELAPYLGHRGGGGAPSPADVTALIIEVLAAREARRVTVQLPMSHLWVAYPEDLSAEAAAWLAGGVS